ncbi:MAG: hypothetical protein ACO4CH_01905 [Saprospiraceae bacterium]|jgi:hypothetical protein
MKIRFFIALMLLCVAASLQAQSVRDALRYSKTSPGFTARSLGVGGSLGSLGADLSVLTTNPAGLAWYRSSEISITPGVAGLSAKSRLTTGLANPEESESVTSFILGNAGLVIHSRPKQPSKWRTFNFAASLSRTASFRRELYYTGESPGSMTDRFVELANGYLPEELEQIDPFEAYPAWQVFAIDNPDPDAPRTYVNDFAAQPSVMRSQSLVERGSIMELALSFATNYDEKLMLGATIGFPLLNYEYRSAYNETDIDSIDVFEALDFNEQLDTRGIGVNLRLGFIYRASQLVRVGLAFHTPSWISMDDTWSTTIAFLNDVNFERLEAESPIGEFSYNLATPWRVIGSAGMVFGASGFLTAEVEYLDYGSANFNFTKNDPSFQGEESSVNRQIDDQLGSAIAVRVGGEMAWEVFRFRAGLGLQQSPFQDDRSLNESIHFGLGIRENGFFLDLGYRYFNMKEGYVPYTLVSPSRQQQVDLTTNRSDFLLTLGFRF